MGLFASIELLWKVAINLSIQQRCIENFYIKYPRWIFKYNAGCGPTETWKPSDGSFCFTNEARSFLFPSALFRWSVISSSALLEPNENLQLAIILLLLHVIPFCLLLRHRVWYRFFFTWRVYLLKIIVLIHIVWEQIICSVEASNMKYLIVYRVNSVLIIPQYHTSTWNWRSNNWNTYRGKKEEPDKTLVNRKITICYLQTRLHIFHQRQSQQLSIKYTIKIHFC